MGRIERVEILRDAGGQRKFCINDSLQNAFGDFVAAIVAVVRFFGGVGEGDLRLAGAKRFVEFRAAVLQIDQCNILLLGDFAHGVGIIVSLWP